MSKLYIMTLNWNGEEKLKRLTPTLIDSLTNIDYEWYIKDNSSKDNSVNYLKSLNNEKIKVFEYKDNRQNFSAGMNYLFNEIKPNDNDLILLLNNDVYFADKSSLSKMIKIMSSDSNIGVVGAKLLYTDSNLLQHAGVIIHNQYQMPVHFRSKDIDDKHSSNNRLFQAVTGAVLLTKAVYFRQACTTNKSGINGMDENFHWAFDDIDFCLSINYNLNKKIVYCGETHIFHDESASLKKNPANVMFMTHNTNLLKNKWAKKWIIDHQYYKNNLKHNLYK